LKTFQVADVEDPRSENFMVIRYSK